MYKKKRLSRYVLSSALILILLFNLEAAAYSASEESDAPSGKNPDLFTYDEMNPPEVFFFPADKARWDGNKITVREWYMLSDAQKQRFISEYMGEIRKQYNSPVDIASMDYLKALNMFSYFSSDRSSSEPTTKIIDKLLTGQGKIATRSTDTAIQKR
ncbi:MAG: hypothetical protein KBB52_06595 [Candidatus Omnitrophica bacterium]|nr:hypothetical protein [Candidatus Omnitrophota bacterium]